jgi:hypothetical protein
VAVTAVTAFAAVLAVLLVREGPLTRKITNPSSARGSEP